VKQVVRVLVVDDSAYVRKVIKQILSRSPFVEVVGTARDGAEALELAEQLRPDVVTLDLMMPRMDGVTFLKEQMARRPLPVIVVSITSESGELMLRALEAGAVDMIQKPTALATEKVFEIGDELLAKVKAAAGARLTALAPASPRDSPPMPTPPARTGAVDIVVLGVSTGGPQALKYLIPQLPADLPVPLAMVLHMPTGYTELYARSLNEASRLAVAEAHEGDLLRPGVALLAPAGHHLSFHRAADGTVSTHLDLRPLDTPHRPAVDVLFQSAAEVFGSRVLGVVMSGMGSDGTKGAAWIKAQGGMIFTEAEETCVVYGMPRSVAEAGLSDRSLPLTALARAILEAL
jgi:two-component system, chemotaxis family, protein-glutamate methylesterase/glutaminase